MRIGDISKSRIWLTVNRRPFAWWRWWFSFAPTYNGTIFGLHIGLPFMVVLGHVRDTSLTTVKPLKQSEER